MSTFDDFLAGTCILLSKATFYRTTYVVYRRCKIVSASRAVLNDRKWFVSLKLNRVTLKNI